jgi:hypothetical protein
MSVETVADLCLVSAMELPTGRRCAALAAIARIDQHRDHDHVPLALIGRLRARA